MELKLVLVPGISGNEYLWQYQIRHIADMAEIVYVSSHLDSGKEAFIKLVDKGMAMAFELKETQQPYQSASDKTIRLRPENNKFYWQTGTETDLDPIISLEGSFLA